MKKFKVYAVAGILKNESIRRMTLDIEAKSLAEAIAIAQPVIDARPTTILTITSAHDE